ncbi:xylosyltransferase oxt-like [Oppia nitens]|uniref:xylosyltransferase oxt-like n=1 Tax=Oppia nitens TaxID=1686743 RepID=UPI0023DBF42F|nr:xylosyltransferase oxt-like [Oppia nitens]
MDTMNDKKTWMRWLLCVMSVAMKRPFRRYSSYVYIFIVILIIQMLLCIAFYSTNNSSIESQIQTKFISIDKLKKLSERADQSIGDYELENKLSFSNSKDLKQKDLSQKQLNDFKQQIDLMNISIKCDILSPNGKYGVSAIERATTHECKQRLADITCSTITAQLYPQSLPRYCPLKDGKYGDYLGCFSDNSKPRVLNGYRIKFSDNSPDKCLTICLQSGFTFAGLKASNDCYCGHELSVNSHKLPINECNIWCSGVSHLKCGGFDSIDIYKTGIKYIPKVVPNLETTINGRDIRIVFLMTLNGRSLRQIKRLLKNIYSKRHFYFIHIDSRQEYLFREMVYLEEKLSNIRVSRIRLSTIWGGASLLQMIIKSISQILNIWSNSWHFIINLSESDFPLKPISDLENFLAANINKNFVKSHGQDSQRFISKQGLDKTFYECDTHMWRVGDRQLPTGIHWDGGSDWVVLSYKFCHYITFENNELLEGLKHLFKYTLLPAESFFHTVLQNSEFCTTIVDHNLRLTNWRRKQGCKCQYKHIVDWCGCSPNDFKTNDWTRIVSTQSKPLFFGRKFEAIVNQNIINNLEELINKNFSQSIIAVNKYWQNDYHIKDSHFFVNDAKLTFYYAFAINSQKIIENKCNSDYTYSQNKGSKALHLSLVKEVNLYFESDSFEGILITFESKANDEFNSILTFETLIRPLSQSLNKPNKSPKILISLEICSDFDVKESVFRNFGCILGPFSKPIALHKWQYSNQPFSATFVWVDPINTVAASYEVKIQINATLDQPLLQKPQLNTPLRPGIWKLIVLHKWTVITETQFLITPLLFYNNTKVDKEMAKQLHNGPKQLYTAYNFSSIEKFLGFESKNPLEKVLGLKNSRKSRDQLLNWIHHLYSKFWFAQRICYLSDKTSLGVDFNCDLHLPECHSTDWSSQSADPKSDISILF